MQNFAFNGGLLNGDPEVWVDGASVSVVIQAAGEVMQGLTLSGLSQVALSADLSLAYMAKLAGAAGISFSAAGILTNGLSLVGTAPVALAVSGDVLRWVMLEGSTPTVLSLDGDIVAVPAISATFALIMNADLDLHVAVGRKLEGYVPVALAAGFQAYSVRATALSGMAAVEFAGIGYGNLIVTLPPGVAALELGADGDTRLGAKLALEGSVIIETYARGYLEILHYVYAEGSAALEILSRAETHGIPTIPGYYVEAPLMRALRVGEEARRFTVPAERRV